MTHRFTSIRSRRRLVRVVAFACSGALAFACSSSGNGGMGGDGYGATGGTNHAQAVRDAEGFDAKCREA